MEWKMAESKIEIKVGGVSFSGEGGESWLSAQLDKMLKYLPELVTVVPPQDKNGDEEADQGKRTVGTKAKGTLAAFLTTKSAKTNKTRKFLATALWLQDQGNDALTTNAVTKAVSDNKQGSLGNASQCLVQNVKQGFCERTGKKQFYVTDEGRSEIG